MRQEVQQVLLAQLAVQLVQLAMQLVQLAGLLVQLAGLLVQLAELRGLLVQMLVLPVQVAPGALVVLPELLAAPAASGSRAWREQLVLQALGPAASPLQQRRVVSCCPPSTVLTRPRV